jgi:hypothetical protein
VKRTVKVPAFGVMQKWRNRYLEQVAHKEQGAISEKSALYYPFTTNRQAYKPGENKEGNKPTTRSTVLGMETPRDHARWRVETSDISENRTAFDCDTFCVHPLKPDMKAGGYGRSYASHDPRPRTRLRGGAFVFPRFKGEDRRGSPPAPPALSRPRISEELWDILVD